MGLDGRTRAERVGVLQHTRGFGSVSFEEARARKVTRILLHSETATSSCGGPRLHDRRHAGLCVLGALPLASLEQTKALIMDPIRDQLKQNVRAENAALANLRGGDANREALLAFQEKRDPDFSGL